VRPASAGLRVLGVVLVALSLAGCGLIAASAPTAVQIVITRGFGAYPLHTTGPQRASGGESVLAMTRRTYQVSAGGAGSGPDGVAAIDGLAGGRSTQAGQAAEWFFYVNGVSTLKGPGATSVHPGDHIWWDLHAPGPAPQIPAVVGSFPEPFLNGVEGARLPVRIECASVSNACRRVTASLRGAGVPAAIAAIGSGGAPETLRVMVGPWSHLEGDLEAQSIGRGPRASGVYARFSPNGRELTLLNEQGGVARTLLADTGLVAATRAPREAPVWVITGTDAAGVELAARAFDRSTLEDRFAVALVPGAAIALPVAVAATNGAAN